MPPEKKLQMSGGVHCAVMFGIVLRFISTAKLLNTHNAIIVLATPTLWSQIFYRFFFKDIKPNNMTVGSNFFLAERCIFTPYIVL